MKEKITVARSARIKKHHIQAIFQALCKGGVGKKVTIVVVRQHKNCSLTGGKRWHSTSHNTTENRFQKLAGVFPIPLRIALKTLLWRVWNYPIDFKCCFSHFQLSLLYYLVILRQRPKIRYFSITIVVQLIWLLKRVKIYTKWKIVGEKITHPQKYRKIPNSE